MTEEGLSEAAALAAMAAVITPTAACTSLSGTTTTTTATTSSNKMSHGSFKQSTKRRRHRGTSSPSSSSKPLLATPQEPMNMRIATTTTTTASTSTNTTNTGTRNKKKKSQWEEHVYVPPTTTNNSQNPAQAVTTEAPAHSLATPVSPASTSTTASPQSLSPSATSIALDFSANACVYLQGQDLTGALHWYQRALLVYQDANEFGDAPLSIVDTCNAAATLHNMGAVYNALARGDAALQCYHDAEQLYRECRIRLDEESLAPQTLLSPAEMQEQETVCLLALIAETLHHRAQIYETSVWDSVAALECHEACVQLLKDEPIQNGGTLLVTCVDDVYFQQDVGLEAKLEFVTTSYQALVQLYRNSDSPQDGLVLLRAWQTLLQDQQTKPKWRKSLAECWKQLSEFHFTNGEMEVGAQALHTAMDLQLALDTPAQIVLTPDLLQQMNRIGAAQESAQDYDLALASYEKVLLLVSRYLGEDHWEVAETLVKIGRVMELQGNVGGGLDLYHAAHTIYQAAIRDDDDHHHQSAATESVVRIANVLMAQQRPQEAVQFLRELPQAKQWMASLDDNDNHTKSTIASHHNTTTTTIIYSVDQAIVFRELGRAYLGMGELPKAKQCLLESARRLEGTDHEEDVFELLMHVEFCQKQQQKRSRKVRTSGRLGANNSSAATAITKDAVAAVLSPGSVASSSVEEVVPALPLQQDLGTPPRPHPSSHEKAQSLPASPVGTERTMETKPSTARDDAVLANLALPTMTVPKSPRSPTRSGAATPPPRPTTSLLVVDKLRSTPPPETTNSADSRSLASLGTATLSGSHNHINKSTTAIVPTTATVTTNNHTTNSNLLDVRPPNNNSRQDDEDDNEDPFSGMNRDSFQIQRAKDIILKRGGNHDAESSKSSSSSSSGGKPEPLFAPNNEDDDGKSDVVSSVLVGLDIDIDLPPTSPSIQESRSGSALAGLVALPSASNEKPFDDATLSQSSSRERPFDEPSLQGSRSKALKPPSPLNYNNAGRQMPNYAASVQAQMMLTLQDEGSSSSSSKQPKRMATPELVPQTMSDLTSTYGQSSSCSLNEEFANIPFRAGPVPSLLPQNSGEEEDADPFKLLPPPPPPPTLPTSHPAQIETTQSSGTPPAPQQQEHDSRIPISLLANQATVDMYPTQRLSSSSEQHQRRDHPESPKRLTANEAVQFSPMLAGHDQTYQDHGPDDDDDDASSDPFEGYEDFDDEDDASSADSASYGGDSESEQGYTRFSREDLSSEEEDNSVGSYSVERNDEDEPKKALMRKTLPLPHDPAVCDDTRQPNQAHEEQPDNFSAGTRESPVPTPSQPNAPTTHAPGSGECNVTGKRDCSPTFDVQEKAPASAKETSATATPPPPPPPSSKRSVSSRKQGSELTKGSPGNRIVKALSNSIRRRRKSKKGGRFQVVVTSDAEAAQANGEVKQEESAPLLLAPSPIQFPVDTIERQESDTFAGGPIQFVSMASPSYDETVSQITFAVDDNYAKYNKSSQWWGQLSLPTEQLEGYLHQAVEAAEGFLSAKAIHAKMKSQPLDFDSEEEEDDDLIVRDPSTLPVATMASKADAVGCSPIPNSLLFKSINQPNPTTKPSLDEIKTSPMVVEKEAIVPYALSPPSSIVAIEQNGLPSPKSNVDKEIEHHEKLLKQFELEALNDDKATLKVAGALFRLSILFLQNEKVDEALKATNEALRHQKFLGDLPNAARSLHLLADIFVRKGEYESALSCYAEVQELELDLYGYIHEETANTLNRIGSVLARQSKFSMAMDKHQEALRILKECHGEELRHPLVSQTLIHIGAVYYRERNSLATVRTGMDGYSTFIEAGMLEVIGRAHEDRGSYKMAISFFEEKLQCLHQKRKDSTSAEGLANLEDVATTLNSLGMLSCRAGIFMEAIDYYDKALEVQKQIGCDKMHLATARVLTATVQFHLGFFQKALRMLQDALKELQAETGSEHETVAATWFQIGVVQVALCEYDDGMDALEEALRIQTNLLGKVHPATLRTRREIGNMYAIYESELEAAFCQFHDILTLQRRIHGHKHPNVAETLHSLGCAYARKGDYVNAIKTLEECYYMRIDYLGADHPLQATTLHEIAEIHRKRQRYRKAIHICNAVLEIRKESLSERHIDVARALATKASCLVVTGDYSNAMKCLQEALGMAEQAIGARHPAVADIFVHMGGIHLRKCHFDEAKEWIGKALDIYQNSNLDEDHPSLKEATALMERVDRDEMLCV